MYTSIPLKQLLSAVDAAADTVVVVVVLIILSIFNTSVRSEIRTMH